MQHVDQPHVNQRSCQQVAGTADGRQWIRCAV